MTGFLGGTGGISEYAGGGDEEGLMMAGMLRDYLTTVEI